MDLIASLDDFVRRFSYPAEQGLIVRQIAAHPVHPRTDRGNAAAYFSFDALRTMEAHVSEIPPGGVTATLLSNDTVPVESSRVRLDVQRLTLVQWATTEKWPTELARFLIIESGAVAVDLEGGKAQIGRSYGGQETLVAPPETGSPAAEADPDPQAGTEEDESGGDTSQTPVPTPPVPPLSGTVAGLSMGDVAIVTGIGAVEFQGAGEGPSTLLSISLVSADTG